MPAKSHGMSGPSGKRARIYSIWANMKVRCNNPNYERRWKDYGGRGITLCKRWEKFENFYADVGDPPSPLHSIDRKDNNKGYYPANVKWSTAAEQNVNSRRCVMVQIGEETKPINVWCREHGIPYVTYKQRMRNGWDRVTAVTKPPNPRHRRTGDGQ